MKKQLAFAAVIISALAISCTKGKVETTKGSSSDASLINNLNFKPVYFDPLKIGLTCRFDFDGSLVDSTGQLKDALPVTGLASFTSDRKGVPGHAIKFDSSYGLNIYNVPLGPDMSIGAWVQTTCYPTIWRIPFLEGDHSFNFTQLENEFQVGYQNPPIGPGQYVAAPSGREWHHLAATRDSVCLKFYIDGLLVGSSPSPAGSAPPVATSQYVVGYGYNGGYRYWSGAMDDLRIYRRVLGASEIYKLAHL